MPLALPAIYILYSNWIYTLINRNVHQVQHIHVHGFIIGPQISEGVNISTVLYPVNENICPFPTSTLQTTTTISDI